MFLAQKLGMMVCDLDRMPQAEYVRWGVYYARKAQRQELEAKKPNRR